jgi:hypothetical protein
MANHYKIDGVRELMSSLRNLHKAVQEEYRKSMQPIPVFVESMLPVHKRMTDILPKKPICDRLVDTYIDTSETFYRMIHVPTFREQYELYWEGKLQSDFFLPQLLSILSIGSRFDTKSKGMGHERNEGVHIPTACALVRNWLDGLKGKLRVEITTLQVEILLLQAQRMIIPRPQDSWTQLGCIVRMAMTMGMHRDPSEFEPALTVFWAEMRRRLWFTIVDMDLHTSLACNLPCLVREGDYTCRPPLNLFDSELFVDMQELPPARPIDEFTDNQMQVYAAMTLPVRMKVCHLLNRIDSIRDFQEILEVGSKLDRYLEDINYLFPRHGFLSDSQKNKQWRNRVVLDMHCRRPMLALYRPFALGVPETPSQITRAYLRSSMVILRYLDELDPFAAHFQDVSDMYHQVLKLDILQAAFSVCFYVKTAISSQADMNYLTPGLPGWSPDPAEENGSVVSDSYTLWSPSRLIKTAEQTLELLVRNTSANDVKDIIALTVVLYSVQGYSREQKIEDIRRGMRAVLDSCMRSTNLSSEILASHSLHHSPAAMDRIAVDPYGTQQRSSFLYRGSAPASAVRINFHHDPFVLLSSGC